ncbi:MAG: transposase [Dehalococcoidia bacterium]|nr:transposase [Dehalococcoidia bacterium]
MIYDSQAHHRRSIRLPTYDYSQPGAYFVTLCAEQRTCLFGEIVEEEMRLNEYGAVVRACWHNLPVHFPYLTLDEMIVMPNHVHGILALGESAGSVSAHGVGAGLRPAPTVVARKRHGLPEIVRALKSFSARRINTLRGTPGTRVWQRNYYERVMRNHRELEKVREYITTNVSRWALDRENPSYERGSSP